MSDVNNNSNIWQKQQCKNTKQLAAWTLTWLFSTALLVFGAKYLWDYQQTFSTYALLFNLSIGVAMIFANIKHLNGQDEMQRKITQDANSITLGTVLIAGIGYGQLHNIQLIAFEPQISHLILLMGLTYIISIFIGYRKYR